MWYRYQLYQPTLTNIKVLLWRQLPTFAENFAGKWIPTKSSHRFCTGSPKKIYIYVDIWIFEAVVSEVVCDILMLMMIMMLELHWGRNISTPHQSPACPHNSQSTSTLIETENIWHCLTKLFNLRELVTGCNIQLNDSYCGMKETWLYFITRDCYKCYQKENFRTPTQQFS